MTSASGQSALAPWRQATIVLALIGVIALLGTLAATPDETESLSLPVLLPALLLILVTAFAARDRTSPAGKVPCGSRPSPCGRPSPPFS